MRWTSSNDFHHDMVFICVSQYCLNYVHFRHWQGFQLCSDTNHRLCHDTDVNRRVVLCGGYDDSGYHPETNSLAAEGRRQRRGRLQGSQTRQKSKRLKFQTEDCGDEARRTIFIQKQLELGLNARIPSSTYTTCFTLPLSTAYVHPVILTESGIALLFFKY